MKKEKILKKGFGKELIKKIEKEEVKQIPKYVFVIKHLFVWIFLIFSLSVWALALSITFEYLFSADWFLAHKIWVFRIFTVFMPFFWLVFLLISVFLSYYNFRHTQRWYKFSFLQILGLNIVFSVLFWILLYFTWIGHYVESKIENLIPKYRDVFVEDRVSRMVEVWQNESEGVLIWEVVKIGDSSFSFTDYNEKIWTVLISDETNIKRRVNLSAWEKIKIIWEKKEEWVFEAKEIRPFMGRGREGGKW